VIDHVPVRALRALLHRHALAADRHRAAVGQRLGLDETEVVALEYLGELGALTPGQLAALLLMTTGGVTALAGRLERAGHVVRGPHPESRRSRLLTPTPSVLAAIRHEAAVLDQRLDHLARERSAQEREVIARFLSKVVAVTEGQARRLVEREPERAVSPS
jgi:DNA-binding MarR family transcriptional regulator